MILSYCNDQTFINSLEPKDWITIFSVIAVIIGWFVNSYLNRKNEIAKKRLDHRLPALKSFLKMYSFITKNSAPFSVPTFLALVEKVRGDFQVYGQKDEVELFEKFIRNVETKNLLGANETLEKLVPLVIQRIRKELNISNGYAVSN